MGMEGKALLLGIVLELLGNGCVDGRQMCWTCQFVLNGVGKECVSSPANWTGGVSRMRCPHKCVIMAEFDAQTGDPTFFHRGCGTSEEDNDDACSDNGSRHSCFFTCGDGKNYCNDKPLPRSPLMDEEDGHSSSSFLVVSLGSLTFVFLVAAMNLDRGLDLDL